MSEWPNFVIHYIDIKAGKTRCKCGKNCIAALDGLIDKETTE
jgi:hypothetical protein